MKRGIIAKGTASTELASGAEIATAAEPGAYGKTRQRRETPARGA